MTTAYTELVSALYKPEDQAALEWAIGSIYRNGPKKTTILYGPPASGKTTMLRIIESLFLEESIFLSIDLGSQLDRTTAIEVRGHQFMEFNRAPNEEETNSIPDLILVQTSGKVLTPGRYQQLVTEIMTNPDELPLIEKVCIARYLCLGPYHYDHVIPNHIPEENNQ